MSQYLSLLQAEFPVLLTGFAFGFGLIIGSFLNVVIYRIPVMLERSWTQQAREILELDPHDDGEERFDLVRPGSRCPECGHTIRPWENIPLLSYLWLKGRCSHCHVRIPLRYPLVELLTGILTAIIVYHFGPSPTGLFALLLTWSLIALALIDYDTQLLPDDITLPFLWLGLTASYFGTFSSLDDAVIGAIAGYLVLWTVFQAFRIIRGKEGMGYGDFKLLAMLGAWLGWQALPLIIILSSFAGALIGGTLILLGRDRDHPIPFGPYLSIAGFVTLLWGDEITQSYLQFMRF